MYTVILTFTATHACSQRYVYNMLLQVLLNFSNSYCFSLQSVR